MSVFRCYSEKKPGFDVEAQGLCRQLREQLGVESLESVRILNRYDADHIDPAVYQAAKTVVFSEPQVDDIWDETYPAPDTVHSVLAVEALPGQFDQRADSCAQCIQLQSGVDRPLIAYAKVYLLGGQLSQNELEKIRKYLINPVESREASVDKPATLVREHAAPDRVAVVEGFTALDEKGLAHLLSELGLAMDLDDLKFLQTYFRDEEKRDPTITEVLERQLAKWGYEASHVTDFQHVLETFVQQAPHLVLLDISLPFYDGYHWCGEIRKISKTPVLFISSASDNMNLVMALNMGGDDFLAKPFDLNVAIAKIEALLRRTYDFGAGVNALACRGAVLDLKDASLHYNSQKLELTKNEFRILQLLFERRGRTVPREDIMQALWESDSFIDDNTLTVNVARLRAHLAEIGLEGLIRTQKGLGYLVDET